MPFYLNGGEMSKDGDQLMVWGIKKEMPTVSFYRHFLNDFVTLTKVIIAVFSKGSNGGQNREF